MLCTHLLAVPGPIEYWVMKCHHHGRTTHGECITYGTAVVSSRAYQKQMTPFILSLAGK